MVLLEYFTRQNHLEYTHGWLLIIDSLRVFYYSVHMSTNAGKGHAVGLWDSDEMSNMQSAQRGMCG